MTDIEIAGELPDRKIVRSKSDKPAEPRDGSWVRWKIADELVWIRKYGGILSEDGSFNPKTWKALVRTKLLAEAIGRGKTATIKAADGNVATYLVVESSMNRKTKNSVIGVNLIAERARVSTRTVSDANWRIHQLGLWRMSERHKTDGKWASNHYDFSEAKDTEVLGHEATTLPYAMTLIVKPQKFVRDVKRKKGEKKGKVEKRMITSRSPARMTVLVWVLDQIILKQASASFTLAELVNGTGLQRRAAKSALKSLLDDGTLVKIGEGIVSLPEALARTHSRTKVDGPFWSDASLDRDRPAFNKRNPKLVPQAADGDVLETSDGDMSETSYGEYEAAYGMLDNADGNVLETADGLPETSYGMPETADKPLATSLAERPEELIPPASSPCRPAHAVSGEPLSPQVRSGNPSLPAGATVDDSDTAEMTEDEDAQTSFDIDALGPAELAIFAILNESVQILDEADEKMAQARALAKIEDVVRTFLPRCTTIARTDDRVSQTATADVAVEMANERPDPAAAAREYHAQAKALREAHPSFRTDVVAAVGSAAPVSNRLNEAAITQAVDGILVATIKSGREPDWAIAIIADAARRLVAEGRRFDLWGGEFGGVRRVIDDAINARPTMPAMEHHHEIRPF